MNRFYKTFSGIIAAIVISAFAAESCFAGVADYTADNHILQASEFDNVIIKDIVDESFNAPELSFEDVEGLEADYPVPEELGIPESSAPEPAGAMPALLTIENPASGSSVGNTLNISGWALYTTDGYTDNIFHIELQLDNKLLSPPPRSDRSDLMISYPGYGDYSRAGFSTSLDISSYSNGLHTLFVRVWSSNSNAVATRTIFFYKQVQSGKPLVYNVDSPFNNQLITTDTVTVAGWALYTPDNVTNGISRVDLSIDNIPVEGDAELGYRPDVEMHFTGYPFYDKAGFSKSVSLTNITYGIHTITVRIWGLNGQLLDSHDVSIDYRQPNYKPLLYCIDSPSTDEIVYENLNLVGWVLFSEDGINNSIDYIELFLDGHSVGQPDHFFRDDLVDAVPGYGDYSKAGFAKTISMDGYNLGWHTISADIYDVNGNMLGTFTVPFNLKSNTPKPFIGLFDSPSELETVKDILNISGWALCTNDGATSEINTTEIFIDGMSQGTALYFARPDLEDAIQGYGDYSRAGFKLDIATTGMSYGRHTVSANFYNLAGALLGTISRSFNVTSDFARPFVGHIDTPVHGGNVNNILDITGWALYSNDGINNSIWRHDILIDGENYGEPAYYARNDLLAAFPNYGDYSRSGFTKSIDISTLSVGNHILAIRVYDYNGTIVGELSTMFERNPSLERPFIAHFDSPYLGQTVFGKLTVRGWGLYTKDGLTSGISHVQVLLDGEPKKYANQTVRHDLYSAFPGYGDYSNAGFTTEIDTTGLISGTHTITIKFYSSSFALVGQISTQIIVQPTSIRPFIGNIDSPSENLDVPYGSNVSISGWAAYSIDGVNSAISSVEILVDSISIKDAILVPRQDIGIAFPDYGDYSKAGFEATISTLNLSKGSHKIMVRVWSTSNQALGILTKNINVY